jgi:hypothetical protein
MVRLFSWACCCGEKLPSGGRTKLVGALEFEVATAVVIVDTLKILLPVPGVKTAEINLGRTGRYLAVTRSAASNGSY